MRAWDTYVLLGYGGIQPGIKVFDPLSMQVVDDCSMTSGNSVYSLCRTHSGFMIGTRTGRAWQVLDPPEDLIGNMHTDQFQSIPHGPSGILGLCLLPDERMALANDSGGCWVIDPRQQPAHRCLLITGQEVVCSLAPMGDERIFGLTRKGKGLMWDTTSGELLFSKKLAELSDLVSEINCARWSDSLIFPTQDGSLGVFHPVRASFEVKQGHRGNWYHAMPFQSSLLTFGFQDRQVISWGIGLESKIHSCDTPKGIICGCLLSQSPLQALLVQSSGRAGVYECSEGKWRCMSELPGESYRCCLGHDLDALTLSSVLISKKKAVKLANRIKQSDVNDQEKEGLHQELRALGYEHVSLGVRIQTSENDIPSALRSSLKLVEVLGEQNRMTSAVSQSHISLLFRAYCFHTAHEFLQSQDKLKDQRATESQIDQLKSWKNAIESTSTILYENPVTFPDFLECAEISGEPLMGYWLIQTLKAWEIDLGGRGESREVSNLICEALKQGGSININGRDAMVSICKEGFNESSVLVMNANQTSEINGLELCLKMLPQATGWMIQPMVIFSLQSSERSSPKSYSTLVSAYQSLITRKDRTYGMGPLLNHVIHQLRQLASQPKTDFVI
jgi:hypothetical protein